MARARRRRRGGRRRRGVSRGGGARAYGRVPRHRDARRERPRSRPPGQRQVSRRIRHRVRQVCGRGVRARCGRLRHEAVHRGPAGGDDYASQGAARNPSRGPHRPASVPGKSHAAQGLPAVDHRVARRFAAPHHRRRDLLFPSRPQVHARRDARLRGAHSPPAESARGRSRSPGVLADPPLRARQREADRRREPRRARPSHR